MRSSSPSQATEAEARKECEGALAKQIPVREELEKALDYAALYGFCDVAREILSRGYHDLLQGTEQSDGVITGDGRDGADGRQGSIITADDGGGGELPDSVTTGEGLEMRPMAMPTKRDPIAAALHNKNYKTAMTILEMWEPRQGRNKELLPNVIMPLL